LQYYKPAEHVALPFTLLPAAMTSTTSKQSNTNVAAAAKRRRGKRNLLTVLEVQEFSESSSSSHSDICTYWDANPAFDPQRVLLRRLFIINANKSINVSVGFGF